MTYTVIGRMVDGVIVVYCPKCNNAQMTSSGPGTYVCNHPQCGVPLRVIATERPRVILAD